MDTPKEIKVKLSGNVLTAVVAMWAIVVTYFILVSNNYKDDWLMYGFGVFAGVLVWMLTRHMKALALANFAIHAATETLSLLESSLRESTKVSLREQKREEKEDE